MIACVSPAHSNCEHTLNTLRYADRVKEHQTNPDTVAEHARVEEGENTAEVENSNTTQNAQVKRRPSKGDANSPARGRSNVRPTTSSGANASNVSAIRASPARISKRPSTSAGIVPTLGGAAASTEAAPVTRSSGVSVPQNVLAPSLSSKAAGSPQRNGSLTGRGAAVSSMSANPVNDIPQTISTPATSTAQSRVPRVAAKVRPGPITGKSDETETWRDIEEGEDQQKEEQQQEEEEEEDGEPEDVQTLNLTLSLLSAHKRSIANTVEDMKVEMQLVQSMEDSEDRNVSHYVEELAAMLNRKEASVKSLREQVADFVNFRTIGK